MRLAVLLLCGACGRFGFDPEPETIIDADPSCDPLDSDSVALFDFEAGLPADASGRHVGSAIGAIGPSSITTRCGATSAQLEGGYLVIPDSPAFDLAAGSVELFTRVPAFGQPQTLLSRDAVNTAFNGHFTLGLASDGRVWVRLQRTANDLSVFRCSADPLAPDQWAHVGVSFGAPGLALWVDHVPANGGTIDVIGAIRDCSVPHTFGIDGNDNPLVIGGSLILGVEGSPTPDPDERLTGSIDHIHIRSTWRDFSVR